VLLKLLIAFKYNKEEKCHIARFTYPYSKVYLESEPKRGLALF